jgi:fructoselysine-6-P-deglycase FrlB-like protein
MTDMIAAEPALARRLLGRLAATDSAAATLATAIVAAAESSSPIVVTGCGTSEHAAQAGVEILDDAVAAAGRPRATLASSQAFELALAPPSGLVIGISHEGGTAATNAALEATRRAGGQTAIVTVSDRSPGAALADIVVTTEELDHGWCHVVGYLSPILAMAAVGAHISRHAVSPETVARVLAAGAAQTAAAETAAVALADTDRILVVASGSDRPAGRELVLKIEEGSWIPAAYRDLETFLHGHLPATGARTGLVLILTERRARAERAARARDLLRATRVLGLTVVAILAEELDGDFPADLTPAGRLLVPDAPDLPASVAALAGSATSLQLLAERLARARGTNPDPIRRDDPRYRAAAEAAEAAEG